MRLNPAGFNIIRRSALLPNLEGQVDDKAAPARLWYGNGRPLELSESVWLTARFANTLYRVKFIISKRLAVDFLIVTAFLNPYTVAIFFTEQPIRFRHG